MEQPYTNFIGSLLDISDSDIRRYAAEIKEDSRFHENFGSNRKLKDSGRRLSWYPGISPSLGIVMYIICRHLSPERVVETGVSGGTSSSYLLCAFEKNGRGKLYSIDLPWSRSGESGWLIPDYLRHRWHLFTGKSSDLLLPLLQELDEIDIFLHDSDHSYSNMIWEFRTAWEYLKCGGLLLSHNIDYSDAFSDFCEEAGIRGFILRETGGAVKPD